MSRWFNSPAVEALVRSSWRAVRARGQNLETPIGQQARTQLIEEWKRADEQHRNEARLVNEKKAVRGPMSELWHRIPRV
jgi:hypothetical protein